MSITRPPATHSYEFDEEIERGLRGDMNINNNGADVPKSTIAVGMLLWGVLVALGGWTLTIVSDMRTEIVGQSRDIKALDDRVTRVEHRVDGNTADIRDLQRTRK